MHTGKLEQYKRLIRFGFNILLLAILIFFSFIYGMKTITMELFFRFIIKAI